jgi:hypothetical protein
MSEQEQTVNEVSSLVREFLGDWLSVTHPEIAEKARKAREARFITE